LYQLYSLMCIDEEREAMRALYLRGGFGYGEIKKALADVVDRYFGEARERRKELETQPEKVRDILADGARRARERASAVLSRAQKACGIR
jgi:tryptophanyl-tRNA synthetase